MPFVQVVIINLPVIRTGTYTELLFGEPASIPMRRTAAPHLLEILSMAGTNADYLDDGSYVNSNRPAFTLYTDWVTS